VIVSLQDKLKFSLKEYFASGDEVGLLTILGAHPELVSSEYGEYPDFHRIADIRLGAKCYRVCRQISKDEQLTFMQIDELMDDMAGVPIWLEGEKLKEWAEAEEDGEVEIPVDWENYR
jgi:hypothetical protein